MNFLIEKEFGADDITETMHNVSLEEQDCK